MKKQFRILVVCWIIAFSAVYAGSENEGKTGLSFLKIGVGARATGMGEAYTAVTNDAFSTYWNPAGLLAFRQSNVVFMHNEWLLDVNGEFGAVQFAGKKSSLAFHGYNMNIGNIEVRTNPSSEPLETTSAHYLSLGASYARYLGDNLGVGLTVKYLFEKIFVNSATGYGVDLGFRYRGLSPNLIVAGVIQNLGSMSTFRDESTSLPQIARIGAAYHFPKPPGGVELLIAADLVKPLDENTRFHLGGEGILWNQFAIRLGYALGYENRNLSFGVGFRKSFIQLDYSFTPFDNDLGNGQRFSAYLNF